MPDRKLHEAAASGDREEIERLLAAGEPVNEHYSRFPTQGPYHCKLTPLMEAAMVRTHGTDIVRLLLDHGADVSTKSEARVTAFFYACMSGDLDRIKLLHERGGDPREVSLNRITTVMALFFDSWYERVASKVACVQYLLANGASAQGIGPVGETALHDAAKSGDAEAVELLISAGCSPDHPNDFGWTPLMESGNASVARVLIRHGADWNAKIVPSAKWLERHPEPTARAGSRRAGRIEERAVEQVLQRNGTNAVLAFLEAGIDPNTTDGLGRPLLWRAIEHGNPQAVSALLDHGADVLFRDSLGRTVLHQIENCEHDTRAIVRALIEAGADPAAGSVDGTSVLDAAVSGTNIEAVEELLGNPDVIVGPKTIECARKSIERLSRAPLDRVAMGLPVRRVKDPLPCPMYVQPEIWERMKTMVADVRTRGTIDAEAEASRIVAELAPEAFEWMQLGLRESLTNMLRGLPMDFHYDQKKAEERQQRLEKARQILRMLEG